MDNTVSVSIVIPNLNGRDMLASCLRSIEALDYPATQIECIVVDNGSVDGSQYFLKRSYPDVRVLSLGSNTGYANAINAGAEAATGELLFFLNNDAQPDPDCLSHLVDPILSGEAVCTTAQIINDDRTHIHFDGGGMNFHGIAFQHREGEPYSDKPRSNQACLFPCGAAMVISRSVFLQAGGLDADFFAYFEDVDLGWRLWLLGHAVSYVPQAIAVHKQSQTSRFIALPKLRVLHIRNPLMMIYKNYGEISLGAIWPVAWMLTIRRTLYLSNPDRASFRISDERQLAEPDAQPTDFEVHKEALMEMPELAVSDFVALNDWLDSFPSLIKKRTEIQSRRVRQDEELLPLFKQPFRYCEPDPDYRHLQDSLCEQFGVNRLFSGIGDE